jgi:hypothetical protein
LASTLAFLPSSADAQNSLGQAQQAPNAYNRNAQPLSPYLNLTRGGNAAANYYYGVRPGQMGGPLGSPFSMGMGAQGRQTFFPVVDNLYELDDTKPGDGISPTGHPFGFNNGLGYFGAGMRNQQQGQGQGQGMGQAQGQGSGGRRGSGLR